MIWGRFDLGLIWSWGRFDLGPILFGADLTCYLFKHVVEVLDGSNHLDMCILKLSSLAFQDDMFLFYRLLVYVNNCRTNFYSVPFVFISYFTNFITCYVCSSHQNGTSDHLNMCILKFSNLVFQGDNVLFFLLLVLVYVNNCRTNISSVPFVFFSYFTNFIAWSFCSPSKMGEVTTSICAS